MLGTCWFSQTPGVLAWEQAHTYAAQQTSSATCQLWVTGESAVRHHRFPKANWQSLLGDPAVPGLKAGGADPDPALPFLQPYAGEGGGLQEELQPAQGHRGHGAGRTHPGEMWGVGPSMLCCPSPSLKDNSKIKEEFQDGSHRR